MKVLVIVLLTLCLVSSAIAGDVTGKVAFDGKAPAASFDARATWAEIAARVPAYQGVGFDRLGSRGLVAAAETGASPGAGAEATPVSGGA